MQMVVIRILLCLAALHTAVQAQVITTIAGTGVKGVPAEGIPAATAPLSQPMSLACDGSSLYIVDEGNSCILKVTAGGNITTLVGKQEGHHYEPAFGYNGDGGAATNAVVWKARSIVTDASGNVYFGDYGNSVIRKVSKDGIINTIAGFPQPDGNAGGRVVVRQGNQKTVPSGNSSVLYFSDENNNVVHRIGTDGKLSDMAGNGHAGYSGDGGPATRAQVNRPWCAIPDGKGTVYIADTYNNVVRRVGADGIITTYAGNGGAGYDGDGGPARQAAIGSPHGLALGATGELYITDVLHQVVRRVGADGIIATIAGNTKRGGRGNGGPATAAELNWPADVAVDAKGNVYIADALNRMVRMVAPGLPPHTALPAGTAPLKHLPASQPRTKDTVPMLSVMAGIPLRIAAPRSYHLDRMPVPAVPAPRQNILALPLSTARGFLAAIVPVRRLPVLPVPALPAPRREVLVLQVSNVRGLAVATAALQRLPVLPVPTLPAPVIQRAAVYMPQAGLAALTTAGPARQKITLLAVPHITPPRERYIALPAAGRLMAIENRPATARLALLQVPLLPAAKVAMDVLPIAGAAMLNVHTRQDVTMGQRTMGDMAALRPRHDPLPHDVLLPLVAGGLVTAPLQVPSPQPRQVMQVPALPAPRVGMALLPATGAEPLVIKAGLPDKARYALVPALPAVQPPYEPAPPDALQALRTASYIPVPVHLPTFRAMSLAGVPTLPAIKIAIAPVPAANLAVLQLTLRHKRMVRMLNVPALPALMEEKEEISDLFSITADPQQNELTIITSQGAYTSFTITDLAGKTMLEQPIAGPRTTVKIGMLKAGRYYINLRSGDQVRTGMFVNEGRD